MDGDITEATLSSLRALGFGGKPLQDILPAIENLKLPKTPEGGLTKGYLTISGLCVAGYASGGVRLIRTGSGFSLSVSSPGRAMFDFGG